MNYLELQMVFKKMEDKIHKDVKTLFKLKKEIDDKTIKSK